MKKTYAVSRVQGIYAKRHLTCLLNYASTTYLRLHVDCVATSLACDLTPNITLRDAHIVIIHRILKYSGGFHEDASDASIVLGVTLLCTPSVAVMAMLKCNPIALEINKST